MYSTKSSPIPALLPRSAPLRLAAWITLWMAIVMPVLSAGPLQAADDLSVRQAFEMAGKGEITLIDIRSRGEWRQSGVAPVARPISMHEDGFFQKLDEAVGGDHKAPIALICASGGRSTMMQAQLIARGYTNVRNVPAGMTGGTNDPNGPGWIASGLPVAPFSQ